MLAFFYILIWVVLSSVSVKLQTVRLEHHYNYVDNSVWPMSLIRTVSMFGSCICFVLRLLLQIDRIQLACASVRYVDQVGLGWHWQHRNQCDTHKKQSTTKQFPISLKLFSVKADYSFNQNKNAVGRFIMCH